MEDRHTVNKHLTADQPTVPQPDLTADDLPELLSQNSEFPTKHVPNQPVTRDSAFDAKRRPLPLRNSDDSIYSRRKQPVPEIHQELEVRVRKFQADGRDFAVSESAAPVALVMNVLRKFDKSPEPPGGSMPQFVDMAREQRYDPRWLPDYDNGKNPPVTQLGDGVPVTALLTESTFDVWDQTAEDVSKVSRQESSRKQTPVNPDYASDGGKLVERPQRRQDAMKQASDGDNSESAKTEYSACIVQSNAAVNDLSVQDVVDCLRRIHLDAYVDAFQRNGVDGVLLSNIDEQMMITDFAMSRFEAKKLMMYVKHGWRPKGTDS